MNIIQQQANDFFEREFDGHDSYKEFIQNLRWELDEYNKNSHKFEFYRQNKEIVKSVTSNYTGIIQ
mgnify:CR=1 FL=1